MHELAGAEGAPPAARESAAYREAAVAFEAWMREEYPELFDEEE